VATLTTTIVDELHVQLPVPPPVRDRPRRPKLLAQWRRYSFSALAADITAGVIVCLVALPMALGFAISSGLAPQSGLYCAIVGGFLISALGGSRAQIGGPTGACLILASALVSQHGVPGLVLCTMMAGAMLVALGATGMGTAIDHIPRPVLLGFTTGISITIAGAQLQDFFGLTVTASSPDFAARMAAVGAALGRPHWPSTILASACLVALILWQRRDTRLPGIGVALAGATLITMMFGMPVATIDSRFHGIPSGWPAVFQPSLYFGTLPLPAFRVDLAWTLLAPAFAIAMLAAIESLTAARDVDRESGDRHDPNVELVAQGLTNLAAPLFGGLPAAGSSLRAAVNLRGGARSPVAGIVTAITLLLLVLVSAPLIGHVPLAALSAILLMVAWQMGRWRQVPDLLRSSTTDALAWLVTFALTVFADLSMAVAAGMALAALLFIRTSAQTTNVARVTEDRDVPTYVAVYRITGPFLFGGTDRLGGIADRLDSLPPIVILRLHDMTATDAAGLRAIEELAATVRRSGRAFLVSGARTHSQPAALMARTRFDDHLGSENVRDTYDAAVAHAQELYQAQFQPGFPRGA
jgi:SulP family sulfate permease